MPAHEEADADRQSDYEKLLKEQSKAEQEQAKSTKIPDENTVPPKEEIIIKYNIIEELNKKGRSITRTEFTYHHTQYFARSDDRDIQLKLNFTDKNIPLNNDAFKKFVSEQYHITKTEDAQNRFNTILDKLCSETIHLFENDIGFDKSKFKGKFDVLGYDSRAKFVLKSIPENPTEVSDTNVSLNVDLCSEIFRHMFNREYIRNYFKDRAIHEKIEKEKYKLPVLSFIFNEYILITSDHRAVIVKKRDDSHILQMYKEEKQSDIAVLTASDEVAFDTEFVTFTNNQSYYNLTKQILKSFSKKFGFNSNDIFSISLQSILFQKMTFNSAVVSLVRLNLTEEKFKQASESFPEKQKYRTTFKFLTKKEAYNEINIFLEGKEKSKILEEDVIFHPTTLHRLALWVNSSE